MDKPASSRRINRYTGGDPDTMFCARVYVETKLWGGFWLPLASTIDIGFYLIKRQHQHCRATYLLQRRQHGQAKTETRQSGAQAP